MAGVGKGVSWTKARNFCWGNRSGWFTFTFHFHSWRTDVSKRYHFLALSTLPLFCSKMYAWRTPSLEGVVVNVAEDQMVQQQSQLLTSYIFCNFFLRCCFILWVFLFCFLEGVGGWGGGLFWWSYFNISFVFIQTGLCVQFPLKSGFDPMSLWGWQDVKIQLLTNSMWLFAETDPGKHIATVVGS